jgi:ribosome silencing factor RsfS/YbeB/iojap
MMSATPIPRTLAMSYFADLEVSVIDALPPGRTPVVTKLVSDSRRDEVLLRVRDACLAGGQAYWVCPLIEESEKLQLQTAEDTYAMLVQQLPQLRIGLVHGRLKAEEKQAVDITLLDLREVSMLADYFVLCTAESSRQTAAILDSMAMELKKDCLLPLHPAEGDPGAGWTLLDYADVVVHVFDAPTRSFYYLEQHWKDAPVVLKPKVSWNAAQN